LAASALDNCHAPLRIDGQDFVASSNVDFLGYDLLVSTLILKLENKIKQHL